MMKGIHKKSQIGDITSEYLLATVVVLTILFGVKFDERSVWQLFLEAFQARHNNYTQTISNLDMVDVKTDKTNGSNK
ncbi:hypothetical protein [Moraxella nonliquefaciens]|uniref:Uncharacterized protein n=1 Tax=Moraxella nonliquefaciens TaxID=478 RepID=A0A1B8QL87_MORNO|nr:hypothetical protein [Moraxella nonliquefaciens]OBX84501.1 hypothetical protein A7456_10520 [Moraxella nonliquefaciens]QPT45467.1 hypothetical protein I6G26_05690 [Moraxella nonliquefaciens]QQC30500.1 hypothetical protein I6H63_04480 [Moraxella nonliquefaciens]